VRSSAIELASDPEASQTGFSEGVVQYDSPASGRLLHSSNCTVGVDLNRYTLPGLSDIIRRVLCANAAELMLLSECKRSAGFFCCWTRKEACSKAIGLMMAFDKCCVVVT
jgi:hypothetical protein